MTHMFNKKNIVVLCLLFVINMTYAGNFNSWYSKFKTCPSTVDETQYLYSNYLRQTYSPSKTELLKKNIFDLFKLGYYDDGYSSTTIEISEDNPDYEDFNDRIYEGIESFFYKSDEIAEINGSAGENPTIADFHMAIRAFFNKVHFGSPIMNSFLENHPEFYDMPITRENLRKLCDAENKWVIKNKNEVTTAGDRLAYALPQSINARDIFATIAAKSLVKNPALSMEDALIQYQEEMFDDCTII